MILHLVVYILLHNLKMADRSLQSTEVFLKNQHIFFIGLYRPTSIQQGKSFYGLFYIDSKTCIKCVYIMDSSQHLPRIMRAWESA